MINELKISLSADKFSGTTRVLKHKQLIIGSDLQMQQMAEVEFPNMRDNIDNDAELSDKQKTFARRRFESLQYSSWTAGSFVNAETGEELLPDENGAFPKDVIIVTELEFWQSLPAKFFVGANLKTYYPDIEFFDGKTLAELVYNGLLFSQAKMRERKSV